ncbi:methyl-accepting chemotaxis protein [Roseiterribacter gracilis]|uniref:Signal transduction histidine kinase n=1 Tax=Roseiterribacter gracilis TaxID=2812848 RepID=A0A8S8XI47_9PROT|nr:signal transduction histidine kinase [Rhodospirillales bacterium TMPK1]
MIGFAKSSTLHALESQIAAIDRSQAVIEFELDGTIIRANKNFCDAMGYALNEIQGKHHRMFVDPAEAQSPAYQDFWARLRQGALQGGEFRRYAKGNREIWLQAAYNPILDSSGKVTRIIKFGTDITQAKLQAANLSGQIDAIGKSQAVIEFNLDGTIIAANQNFLSAMGYASNEIVGQHHRMFVEPSEHDSTTYREFWQRLARGEFQSGEFKRVAKGGREVWINASYNPILDPNGKPFKVVKFATEVTQTKLKAADHAGQIEAISKSQAVIEFDLDGTIREANQNFLVTLGFAAHEIQGKHHRMFVDSIERESPTYREFWQKLARGEYQEGEYKRIAKDGREVWIQATYNPILDLNGKPFKVVKFALDVTRQVLARKRSEHVRSMMDSVAAGAEEMNASVQEIATSMSKSRDTAEDASGHVQHADSATQRLASAAEAMGGIVGLIDGITSQINLLALNATIESARAGEAGRGFAVVANEVKSLANQAKEATQRISTEIDSMRGVSDEVVSSLRTIRQSIESVREYVTSTAAAVEEQSAVAREMSTSMQRAAAEAAALA